MSNQHSAMAQGGVPPFPKVRTPFSHRISYFFKLWSFKILANIVIGFDRLIHPPSSSLLPTLVKRYACRPRLQTRIFYPPDYQPGTKLPTLLCFHGGGFIVCDPQFDDEFGVMWAKRTGMLVISLDYSKAPLNPFPTGVHDAAALARAVLDDLSLPIDKDRVAIGGFSAGGSIALGAAQLPGLKGVVKAALIFFPIVDWGHNGDVKWDRRPYRNGPKDLLHGASWWLDWAYVRDGQNRHDPLLSPYYARKEDLPPWMYFIAPEWDILRIESQKMIHELVGLDGMQEDDFELGTYKWTLARGCTHGFTHHWGAKPERRKRREAKCEPIWEQAAQWLKKALENDERHNVALKK